MVDPKELTQDELQEIVSEPFFSLVFSLYNSALISLGKLTNPVTQKPEIEMDQAQVTIDMLAMLSEKTKGNLAQKEQQFLESKLTELRFMFADEIKKTQSSTP